MIKLLPAFLLSIFVLKSFAQCEPGTAYRNLDVNNVRARLNNGGDMWWNLVDSAIYEVPKMPVDSPHTSGLFAGALWIGGLDQNNQLHLAAQTYRQSGVDFFPGPLNSGGTTDSSLCNQFDHMWNVYGIEIDSAIAAFNAYGILVPLSMIPQNVLQWPGKGNPYNPIVGMRDLAPFYDNDMNGIYNPRRGDYPILGGCGSPVYADQMIWWVYNDAGNEHSESGGQPLGIEVQALAYAFVTSDCINDQTFYRFKIINRSDTNYHDVYAALWLDADLGCYSDDYVGCDTSSNMGIVYNADSIDMPCGNGGGYGNQPPLVGIKLLNSLANDPTQRPMSHFIYYNNDFTNTGNPEEPVHFYNYMQSKFKDGTHLTYGGVETDFAAPDDPSLAGGSSDCSGQVTAADRRIVVSSGPATLDAGEEVVLDYAVVWVRPPVGTYAPCPSYTLLKQCAATVQQLYDEQLCANSFVGVNEVDATQTLNLFPNPASVNGSVTVVAKQNDLLEVFDISGRKLKAKRSNGNNATIDLNGLVEGCYVVKLTSVSGATRFAKLIVQ